MSDETELRAAARSLEKQWGGRRLLCFLSIDPLSDDEDDDSYRCEFLQSESKLVRSRFFCTTFSSFYTYLPYRTSFFMIDERYSKRMPRIVCFLI